MGQYTLSKLLPSGFIHPIGGVCLLSTKKEFLAETLFIG